MSLYIKKKITPAKYMRRCKRYLTKNGKSLRDYQKKGVLWMLKRELNKTDKVKGGLLCDEMGLGKTFQMISLVLARPMKKRKTLIVLPCSVLIQWKNEFTKFAPILNVFVHHGKQRINDLQDKQFQNTDVVLTTYNMVFNRDNSQTILQKHKWGRIILDECHYIRNSKSKRHIGCLKLKAKCKWGLTGTPIQNYKTDLYSIFSFIGLSKDFVEINIDMVINKYILRRSKVQLAMNDEKFKLPEKTVEYVELPFATKYEEDFYKKIREGILREINAFSCFGNITINQALEHIMRLRQATIHPKLVIDGYSKKYNKPVVESEVRISTKMQYIIDTIKVEKRKTIIFCSFLKEMDMYETFLIEAGFKVGRIDGSISPENRINIIEKSADIDVMIVQIDAGGTGLNMTMFNRIFITSPSWNPCIELQAIARAHRIGQTKPVKVSKLVIVSGEVDTIDQLIRNRQEDKKEIITETLKDDTYFDRVKYKSLNRNIRSLLK